MNNDVMEMMRVAFCQEAADLLAELDAALLALEEQPGDSELLNRVFRAIHTIKGSGATAGYREMAAFAHNVEEVFDDAREGRLQLNPEIIDLALHSCDLIGKMLFESGSAQHRGEAEQLVSLLARHLRKRVSSPPHAAPNRVSKLPASSISLYRITFRPGPLVYLSGTEPALILEELISLGPCQVQTDEAQIPLLDELEPERCYYTWTITLVSHQSEEAVREVFAFVEDDSRIEITRAEPGELGTAFPGGNLKRDGAGKQCELALRALEDALLRAEATPLDGVGGEQLRACYLHLEQACRALRQLLSDAALEAQPLDYIVQICQAHRALVPEADAAASEFDGASWERLFAGADMLKRLWASSAKEGWIPEPGQLESLGVSPLEPRKKASEAPARDIQDLHSRTIVQCLEAQHDWLGEIGPNKPPTPELNRAYCRSLQTLLSVAERMGLPRLVSMCQAQLQWLNSLLTENAPWDSSAYECLEIGWQQLVAETKAQPHPKQNAPSEHPAPPPAADKGPAANVSASIRVEQEKLDKLMRVVGELLVARNALPIIASKIADQPGLGTLAKEAKDAGSTVSRIANELQDSLMAMRMLPLRTVFQRFPRLVRDLSRSLGKEIQLVLCGESTELDKTVLEQLTDPLVHIVRNAVDHGIEPVAERISAGKLTSGTVQLKAYNEGNQVVIEISDDGKGLDAEMIRKKAVAKGLLSEKEASLLDDKKVRELIFEPGFSTAERVTDLSGRGVGMDVVRTAVRKMQGTVSVESSKGKGSTFRLCLPTRLIISKGIQVKTRNDAYIFPIESILDMAKIPQQSIRCCEGVQFASIRGQVYPLLNLASVFGEPDDSKNEAGKEERSVVILSTHEMTFGVLVEQFVSEVEVLVKPLNACLSGLRVFLGATIMGDGRILLVINPAELGHKLADSSAPSPKSRPQVLQSFAA